MSASSPIVFDVDDWGDFWTKEGGLPSNLSTVQIEGHINEIWRKPYSAFFCAFCFTNKVDFTRFTIFCTSCFRTFVTDKEEQFTKLRGKKRLRKPLRTRKTRSRAVADDSTPTD